MASDLLKSSMDDVSNLLGVAKPSLPHFFWDPTPVFAGTVAAGMTAKVAHQQLQEAFTGMPFASTLGSACSLVTFTISQRAAAIHSLSKEAYSKETIDVLRSYDALFVSYFLFLLPIVWLMPDQKLAAVRAREQGFAQSTLDAIRGAREQMAPWMVRLFFLIFLVLTISVEPVYTLAARHLAAASAGAEEGEGEGEGEETEEGAKVPTTVLLLVFLYIVLVWCSLNIVYESLLARSLQSDFPNEIVALLVPRCIRERVERWVSSTMGLVHQGQELVSRSRASSQNASDALDSVFEDVETKIRRGDKLTPADFDDSWIDTKMKEPWARDFVETCRALDIFRNRSVSISSREVDLSSSYLADPVDQDRGEELVKGALGRVAEAVQAAVLRLQPSTPKSSSTPTATATSTVADRSFDLAAATSTTPDLTRVVSLDVEEICRGLAAARDAGKGGFAALGRAAGEVESLIENVALQWRAWEGACFRLMTCTHKLKFLKWACYRHMHLTYAIVSALLVIYSSATSATLLPNWMQSPIAWCFLLLSFSLAGFSITHSFFSYFGMNKDAGWQPLVNEPDAPSNSAGEPLLSPYGAQPSFRRQESSGCMATPPSVSYAPAVPSYNGAPPMSPATFGSPAPAPTPTYCLPGRPVTPITSGSPAEASRTNNELADPTSPPTIVPIPAVTLEAIYHVVREVEVPREVVRRIVSPNCCPHCREPLVVTTYVVLSSPQVEYWDTRVPNPELTSFTAEPLILEKQLHFVTERPVAFVGSCPKCRGSIDGRPGLPEGVETTANISLSEEAVYVPQIFFAVRMPEHLREQQR